MAECVQVVDQAEKAKLLDFIIRRGFADRGRDGHVSLFIGSDTIEDILDDEPEMLAVFKRFYVEKTNG